MILGIILTVIGALVTAGSYGASKTKKFNSDNAFNLRIAAIFLVGTTILILGVTVLISPYIPLP